MGNVLLNIRDGGMFDRGDAVFAASTRRIQLVHAQHICCGRQSEPELRLMFMQRTHRYRFQRDGRFVVRTDLETAIDEVFGPPQIHAARFVSARKASGKLPIFGAPGREFWFGGTKDFSTQRVSQVWDAIEAATSHRRGDEDKRNWPFTLREREAFLPVEDDELDDEAAELAVEPLLDEDGGIVRQRRRSVDLLSVMPEHVFSRTSKDFHQLRGVVAMMREKD